MLMPRRHPGRAPSFRRRRPSSRTLLFGPWRLTPTDYRLSELPGLRRTCGGGSETCLDRHKRGLLRYGPGDHKIRAELRFQRPSKEKPSQRGVRLGPLSGVCLHASVHSLAGCRELVPARRACLESNAHRSIAVRISLHVTTGNILCTLTEMLPARSLEIALARLGAFNHPNILCCSIGTTSALL